MEEKMFVLIGLGEELSERLITCQCYFDFAARGKRLAFPLGVKSIDKLTISDVVDAGWRRDAVGWKCPECVARLEEEVKVSEFHTKRVIPNWKFRIGEE